MKLVPLPTPSEQAPEPTWTKLLSTLALRKVAAAAWRARVAEMTSAGTLFPGNANTIKRYCIASYDEAATRVAE
ncbi:MAG: hypothetical protein J0H99_15945, partial [Rhodospirillales bacterium]|nr:hypothetical protein [Rhodospirillales bacterium]